MSVEHEQIVDILALLDPNTEIVPRAERIEKMVKLFDTAESAQAALYVAKEHIRDLQRAWRQCDSPDGSQGVV
jgi:hypothetical protein